jgi:hypothetical protein
MLERGTRRGIGYGDPMRFRERLVVVFLIVLLGSVTELPGSPYLPLAGSLSRCHFSGVLGCSILLFLAGDIVRSLPEAANVT